MEKILNLIKRAIQTAKPNDSGVRQKAQVTFLGQTKDIKTVSPYGVFSSSPNHSDWLIWSARCNKDDLYGIPNDYKNRIKNLKEGEVVLMNTLTKSLIHFKESGEIYFFANSSLVFDSESVFNEDVDFKKNVNIDGILTLAGVNVNTHVHGGVMSGGSNTNPMI